MTTLRSIAVPAAVLALPLALAAAPLTAQDVHDAYFTASDGVRIHDYDLGHGYDPWSAEERAIDLRTLDIPVLAIVGEYDGPNRRSHRMARELGDFELVVLPGETHGSAHFNPRCTEALAAFVRERDR